MTRPSNFVSILCRLAISVIVPLAVFTQIETIAVSAEPIPK
ncbi:hypothetical protein NIES3275_11350 [Microchaete diplosiphon NIES-3275]|nr:hypothetical protein NIES3275_11350 [Microchaete diplosiphon NIES-3275]